MLESFFTVILVGGGIGIFLTILRSRHILKALSACVLQGLCAFFAVQIVGALIGVHIPLNAFSAVVSLLGGIPGVSLLLLLQIFLPCT